MDRWPGAYPATPMSEPPTPALETTQPQQQQQQSQSHPQSAPNQALDRDQQARLPAQDQLTRENKVLDSSIVKPHNAPGVGLSNAEYHRLQGRTLEDERQPSVDEAVGGGTYVRENEYFKKTPKGLTESELEEQSQRKTHLPTESELEEQSQRQVGKTRPLTESELEEQSQQRRNVQHGHTGRTAWPLSDVSVQHEQQPRKLQQFVQDDRAHDRKLDHQQQQHTASKYGTDHGHQDIYESQDQPRRVEQNLHESQHQRHETQQQAPQTHQYSAAGVQREVREAQQQPRGAQQESHGIPQQSRSVQHESHEAGLGHGHQPSDLPVAYQQHARDVPQQAHAAQQQGQVLPDRSRDLHQQPQGVTGLSQSDQPSDPPLAYRLRTAEVPQHELRHESRELSEQPRNDQPSSRNTHSATGSNKQSGTPPYWGALPTAATGGIYNTVTGHGSPRDDHDQHHNVSPKNRTTEDTPADSTISSGITSVPRGGVYNTVTGHGSSSEPTHHHQGDSSRSGARFIAGVSNVDDSSIPPQSRNVQHTIGSTGPVPGTTATSSSTAQEGQTHPAVRSTYGETGTQRAFPLTTSDRDTHHDEKPHSNAEKGLAAGALAGAGVAAYSYGTHDNRDSRDTRDAGATQGYLPSGNQRATQAQPTSHHTTTHTEQKRLSPDSGEKHKERHGLFGLGSKHDKAEGRDPSHTATGHGRDPVAAEQRTTYSQPADIKDTHKEHHGLFGKTGTHEKDEHRGTHDNATVPGHPSSSEHRVVAAQSQAQPFSPPNAELKENPKQHHGLLGLVHHGNEEGRDSRDIAPIPGTHPAGVDARATQPQRISPSSAEAKRTSLDAKDDSPKRKGSVLGGIFHRNKDDKTYEEPKHQHQHRRSDSLERRKLHKDPPPSVVQAMRQSTPPQKTSIEEERHRQQYDERTQHGHQGALATGAGVAAGGIAASQLANRHAETQDSARQSNFPETTSRATESGSYQTLDSGTPFGVATGATGASHQSHQTSHQSHQTHSTSHVSQDNYSRGVEDRHSGPYNILADGTPSGIATSRAGGSPDTRNTSSVPYDSATGSNQGGHKTDALAAGAGAAGLMAASRSNKESDYGSNRGVADAHSGTSATGQDSWRSNLPPTVATSGVMDISAAHGTTHDRQSPTSATYVPSATTRDTAGTYSTLESGTASGAAGAGGVTSNTAANTTTHTAKDESVPRTLRHTQDTGASSDLPNPYNVLPSGTPSGVNIEYRRKSKEVERQH
ncbi:hypothetical protein GE09DRAFT_1137888 [Coniochaeta sp. 2T2.1]|nr:hypothetical protein GE09DRAFT_1137888 [Coniochaeta sp. 2T2.1]